MASHAVLVTAMVRNVLCAAFHKPDGPGESKDGEGGSITALRFQGKKR